MESRSAFTKNLSSSYPSAIWIFDYVNLAWNCRFESCSPTQYNLMGRSYVDDSPFNLNKDSGPAQIWEQCKALDSLDSLSLARLSLLTTIKSFQLHGRVCVCVCVDMKEEGVPSRISPGLFNHMTTYLEFSPLNRQLLALIAFGNSRLQPQSLHSDSICMSHNRLVSLRCHQWVFRWFPNPSWTCLAWFLILCASVPLWHAFCKPLRAMVGSVLFLWILFVRLSPDAPRQASMCINALKTECTGYSYVDRQINKWIVHIKQPYKCNDAWISSV